jgi:isopenicillin N synthase-like dioxygenase|tara:strand:+ start:101 stop:1033 length:933 start_codon:yes stop_codon:yes gene_type:complete
MQIPKIDISEIEEKEFSRTLLQDFFSAYNKYGFGYIINHGIEKTLIEQLFQVSKQFHSQPLSEKMRVALDHNHRGYIAINTSTDVNSKLADVKKPNQSESFMMMREDKSELPDVYLSGPNQWPKLENFKEVLEKYTFNMTKLGRNLMRLALLSSGVKDLSVMQSLDTPTIWLRLLHYPPISKNSPSDLYGSAPHTDFGCLTILAQDEIGGLQVQTREGEWIDVPKLEGSFVVNVGDMLSRYTNGLLRSTPHRVINKSGKERFSCPFFFDPHTNAVVQPLKGTGKPKFSPINFGEFLREELEASYEKHKKV